LDFIANLVDQVVRYEKLCCTTACREMRVECHIHRSTARLSPPVPFRARSWLKCAVTQFKHYPASTCHWFALSSTTAQAELLASDFRQVSDVELSQGAAAVADLSGRDAGFLRPLN
jgi:hypothetical protein